MAQSHDLFHHKCTVWVTRLMVLSQALYGGQKMTVVHRVISQAWFGRQGYQRKLCLVVVLMAPADTSQTYLLLACLLFLCYFYIIIA